MAKKTGNASVKSSMAKAKRDSVKGPKSIQATGLRIAAPLPPIVGVYGTDYEGYLEHYQKYVQTVTDIRTKIQKERVDAKANTRVAKATPSAASAKNAPDVHVLPPTMMATSTGAGAGESEQKEKSEKTKRARKGKLGAKAELRAVKMAADLAVTLSKAERAAAKTGRSVVKTKDGWNLVLQPKKKTDSASSEVADKSDSSAAVKQQSPREGQSPGKGKEVRKDFSSTIRPAVYPNTPVAFRGERS